jgi:uncharacterized protein (TIGR02001 family)
MNKKLFTSLLLTSAFLTNFANAANEVSTNIGVTSNYIWRGVTQSNDKISLSAGADYSADSGFYAGVWAASVDFNDDTNFEYDFYAGFQKELTNVTVDVGYIYYGYQGEDDLAFSEVYVKADFDRLALAISTLADSDNGGSFADSTYFEASYNFSLPKQISLDIHAGYSDFKEADSYQDFNISLSKGDFSLMVSTLTGNDALEDTLVSLSYSKSFDL